MSLLADPLKKLIFGRAFKADGGKVSILGRLYVSLYETSALALTVEEVYKFCKSDKKAIAFWHKIGCQVIKEGVKSFNVKSAKGHISIFRTNLNFTDFFGWGKFSIKGAEWDAKKFHITFMVSNSPLLNYAAEMYGNKHHCYTFILGIFEGIITEFLGRKASAKLLQNYSRRSPELLFEVR
jgi:hypothetical protein